MGKCFLLINEELYEVRGNLIIKRDGSFLGICTKEEKLAVRQKLERNKGNLFKSDRLNHIANINPILKSIDVFEDILDDIEQQIPEEYRETFYNNLINLSLNIITKEKVKYGKEMSVQSFYTPVKDEITIILKSIKEHKTAVELLINEGKLTTPFHEHFKRILIHELFHLASSNYKIEENKMYCGFQTLMCNEGNKYQSFTEGVTEMLSRKVYDNKEINLATGYNVQVAIIREFIDLIGYDKVVGSYFSNNKLEIIREELLKIINNPIKVDLLLSTFIDDDSRLSEYDGNDTITKTQELLFEFFRAKAIQLRNSGYINEEYTLLENLRVHFSEILNDFYYSKDLFTNELKQQNIKIYENIISESDRFNWERLTQSSQRKRSKDNKNRKNKKKNN